MADTIADQTTNETLAYDEAAKLNIHATEDKYSFCPECFRKGVYCVLGRYNDDSLECKYCKWAVHCEPDGPREKADMAAYIEVQDECQRIAMKTGMQEATSSSPEQTSPG